MTSIPIPLSVTLLALVLSFPLQESSCDDPSGGACIDNDGDGYGEGSECWGADCDDAEPAINSGATELCNDTLDNNCDGAIDAADASCGCIDNDKDGYGEGPSCLGPDCDDTSNPRNPGRDENCADALDNDCDGAADGVDSDCAAPLSPLELFPNIHTVGVNVELGTLTDPEGDAVATLTYQELPSGPLRTGFPFHQARGTSRMSGSLFFLKAATTYGVSVSVGDVTTPSMNFDLTGQVTTRAEPEVAISSRIYVVSVDGSGAVCSYNNPCSLGFALGEVRAGESIEMYGGTYYTGGHHLLKSGTRDAPITITSVPGERAIWDGADPNPHTWNPVSGYPGMYVTDLATSNANTNCVVADGVRLYPYRSLSDLYSHQISCILATPQPAGLDGFYRDPRPLTTVPYANPNPYYKKLYVKFKDGSSPANHEVVISNQTFALDISNQDYIHMRSLTFRNYGVEPYSQTIKASNTNFLVVDNCELDHNDRGIVLSGNSSHAVIQNSTFTDNTDWDTYLGKATYETESPQLCYQSTPPPYPYNDRMLETGGVVFGHGFSGRGNIIRDNHVAHFMDGFKAIPPSVVSTYTTTENDIYGNTISGGGDDGFEVDGIAANVRVWGNSTENCANGISIAPPQVGPVYVMRNVFKRMHISHATIEGYNTLQTFYGQPIKLDCPCEGGEVYFFHNTVYNPEQAWGLRLFRPTDVDLFYARNNVLVSGDNYALSVATHDPSLPPNDLDYNLYSNQGVLANISINGQPKDYTSLASVTAAYGYEVHGINADPLFVDPAVDNFGLKPGSPAIDTGVIIPGVNDQHFEGPGPDLGAYESGAE